GQVGVVHCLLVAGELDDLDVGVRPVAVGGENSAVCIAPAFGLSHPLVYHALDLCRMSRSDLDDLDEGHRCSSMSGRTATSRVPYVTRHPRIGSGSLPFLWKLGLLTRRFLYGYPDPYRSVRDLGRVPGRCSWPSGIPTGRSPWWLPAWLPVAEDLADWFGCCGPSAFQAGHIPSCYGSCECRALSPVAAARRWSLLLLSSLLS